MAVGPVNDRARTDLFLATFVCGDRVTDLLQPAFEGASVMDSAIWDTFIVSATNDVYFVST